MEIGVRGFESPGPETLVSRDKQSIRRVLVLLGQSSNTSLPCHPETRCGESHFGNSSDDPGFSGSAVVHLYRRDARHLSGLSGRSAQKNELRGITAAPNCTIRKQHRACPCTKRDGDVSPFQLIAKPYPVMLPFELLAESPPIWSSLRLPHQWTCRFRPLRAMRIRV